MYYLISIGFSHWEYKNSLTITEITKGEYDRYTIFSNGKHVTIELSKEAATGYITAIATDKDLESNKETVLNRAWKFLDDVIEAKKEEIKTANALINKVQEYPFYKTINRDIQIDNILN
jgi:hypothetical protein